MGFKSIQRIAEFALLCFCLVACEPQKDQSQLQRADVSGQTSNQVVENTVAERSLAEEALIGTEFRESTSPKVLSYKRAIKESFQKDLPLLLLDLDDPMQLQAQQILANYQGMRRYLYSGEPQQATRTEVMSVRALREDERSASLGVCQAQDCYSVVAYNFFHNLTFTAIVSLSSKSVLKFSQQIESQPDLSDRLTSLANAIALHEPLVEKELRRHAQRAGIDSADIKPLMSSTKSSLNNTLCERSRHLCVAPTFVLGSQALWVIVDLTSYKVAGLRWTNVGPNEIQAPVTQRKIENEFVFENFCEKDTLVEQQGWSFKYRITSSDGLQIKDVRFERRPVIKSAKVVDWHVSYSKFDGFGYSDATGCPMFSSAVVVAFSGPNIEKIFDNGEEVGFAITQDFRQLPWPAPCNYRYEERYEFYRSGELRVAMSNLGRGCGANGTYRPILRMALGSDETNVPRDVSAWQEGGWQRIGVETWSSEAEPRDLYETKFSHAISHSHGVAYYLKPSAASGDVRDRAFIYTSVESKDGSEGEEDLITLGKCCNTDYQQGPEQFLQPPEETANKELVLWYVPQMDNSNTLGEQRCWAEPRVVEGVIKVKTWPCTAGPALIPIRGS